MTKTSGQWRDSLSQEAESRPRSVVTKSLLVLGAFLLFIIFAALGTWQLQRLQWKQALIERVEQRIHAAPVPAPALSEWPEVRAETHEYRRVQVTGTFLHQFSTRVQAVTTLGSGYWLLTPLQTADGSIVLINRGFTPPKGREDNTPSDVRDSHDSGRSDSVDPVTITGLLRMSEPNGAFLRRNNPASQRWYSRDVQAIAAANNLQQVAPYFIDVDAAPNDSNTSAAASRASEPVGGLTVIKFTNNHLVYAITWYALALMVAVAAIWVIRRERKERFHNAE